MDDPFNYPSQAFGAEGTALGEQLARYANFSLLKDVKDAAEDFLDDFKEVFSAETEARDWQDQTVGAPASDVSDQEPPQGGNPVDSIDWASPTTLAMLGSFGLFIWLATDRRFESVFSSKGTGRNV